MTTSRERVLVTAEALAALVHDRTGDLVVLHVGDERPKQGIVGALPVDARVFAGVGGGTRGARPLPEIADLQRHVRSWGINESSIVVLYDDKGGLQAARGWWVLRWAGLTNVRLLDGGLAAWTAAHGAVGPLTDATITATVALSAGHLPVLDADDAADFARRAIMIDARGASAFAGDPIAGTGGHIPGAINTPASRNLTAEGRFHDDDTLRAQYAVFAADSGATVGVTCGSGISAAHTIVALASIGITASLYPASWSGWSADPQRPIAFNPA